MRSPDQDLPPPTDHARPWGRADLLLAGLFALVTLAMRVMLLLRSQDTAWPHGVLYEGDAPVWAQWAAALSSLHSSVGVASPGSRSSECTS